MSSVLFSTFCSEGGGKRVYAFVNVCGFWDGLACMVSWVDILYSIEDVWNKMKKHAGIIRHSVSDI